MHRRLAIRAATIAITSALVVAPFTHGRSSDMSATTPRGAIELRAEFGMAGVRETTGTIAANRIGSDALPGPSTTEAQVQDDIESASIQAASVFRDTIVGNPATFAGFELDHSASPVVKVYVARADETTLISAVRAAAPKGLPVEFVNVATSWRDLQGLEQRIVADSTELAKGQIQLQAVGINTAENAVHVSIHPWDQAKVALLRERYGASISVSDEAFADATCTDIQHCTPWRGGIYIYVPSVEACTSGFNVKTNTSLHVLQLVTAAHCNSGGWYHTVPTSDTRQSTQTTCPIRTAIVRALVRAGRTAGHRTTECSIARQIPRI